MWCVWRFTVLQKRNELDDRVTATWLDNHAWQITCKMTTQLEIIIALKPNKDDISYGWKICHFSNTGWKYQKRKKRDNFFFASTPWKAADGWMWMKRTFFFDGTLNPIWFTTRTWCFLRYIIQKTPNKTMSYIVRMQPCDKNEKRDGPYRPVPQNRVLPFWLFRLFFRIVLFSYRNTPKRSFA